MKNSLGYKIRKIRELKNISQNYVAIHLGISQAAYSSIESDKVKIDENKLMKIATALCVETNVIRNFNEQTVLSTSSYDDSASLEKLKDMYERLLIEKDSRIKTLEKIVNKE